MTFHRKKSASFAVFTARANFIRAMTPAAICMVAPIAQLKHMMPAVLASTVSPRTILEMDTTAATAVRKMPAAPSGHKVRRIAADIQNGSIASLRLCAGHFRLTPNSGHVAAPQ